MCRRHERNTCCREWVRAQKLHRCCMRVFGEKFLQWALHWYGPFIIGISPFLQRGICVDDPPELFNRFINTCCLQFIPFCPCWLRISVTHGFLPPHPSPPALWRNATRIWEPHLPLRNRDCHTCHSFLPDRLICGITLTNVHSGPLQTFPGEKP
jgi:hypothetical protein